MSGRRAGSASLAPRRLHRLGPAPLPLPPAVSHLHPPSWAPLLSFPLRDEEKANGPPLRRASPGEAPVQARPAVAGPCAACGRSGLPASGTASALSKYYIFRRGPCPAEPLLTLCCSSLLPSVPPLPVPPLEFDLEVDSPPPSAAPGELRPSRFLLRRFLCCWPL